MHTSGQWRSASPWVLHPLLEQSTSDSDRHRKRLRHSVVGTDVAGEPIPAAASTTDDGDPPLPSSPSFPPTPTQTPTPTPTPTAPITPTTVSAIDAAASRSPAPPSAILLGDCDVTSWLSEWGINVSTEHAVATVTSRLKRLVRDEPAWQLLPHDNLRALVFLHVRTESGYSAAVRSVCFRELVQAADPTVDTAGGEQERDALLARRRRLMHLMITPTDVRADGADIALTGLAGSDGAAPVRAWQTYDDFVAAYPEWGPVTTLPATATTATPPTSSVFVCFIDGVDGCLVQRGQIDSQCGPCYMQAPNVLLHYLLCRNNSAAQCAARSPPLTVDLTAYTVRHMAASDVWRLIDGTAGGMATTALLALSGLTRRDIVEESPGFLSTPSAGDEIVRRMGVYGPALIASLAVNDCDDSLEDRACHRHVGGDDPAVLIGYQAMTYHSMVIVGWRRVDSDGSYRFLVQNWWAGKQFFECDVVFLRSRLAHLVWVNKPDLTHLPLPTDCLFFSRFASSLSFGAAVSAELDTAYSSSGIGVVR